VSHQAQNMSEFTVKLSKKQQFCQKSLSDLLGLTTPIFQISMQ
jgi:hypothetical protein